ncbi:hypothetical protein CEXT_595561 [Caerostris extrusa]|uniref:Secreted protein n=1 Tax=Caerostris extrusa TaxID=172846 RepID=A0AAV4XYQ1_CAEEX|nr:hypothetical protein CEXT_595561 [Caerostris extrusa]
MHLFGLAILATAAVPDRPLPDSRTSSNKDFLTSFGSICQEIPSALSLYSFSTSLLFGRHQISRDKQFCAKKGGYQVSKSRFPLFLILFTSSSAKGRRKS